VEGRIFGASVCACGCVYAGRDVMHLFTRVVLDSHFFDNFILLSHTHTYINTCRSRLAELVPSATASALLLTT